MFKKPSKHFAPIGQACAWTLAGVPRRAMAGALCLIMLLGMLPASALGAEGQSTCLHDLGQNDEACGYTEAVSETPCTCGAVKNADGNISHLDGCAYVPAIEGIACKHASGEHNDTCGGLRTTENINGVAPVFGPKDAPPHTHGVDGGSGSETYTAWTSTDSLPTTEGSYYLTEDVTLSADWSGGLKTINLRLNGYTMALPPKPPQPKRRINQTSPRILYATVKEDGSVSNESAFYLPAVRQGPAFVTPFAQRPSRNNPSVAGLRRRQLPFQGRQGGRGDGHDKSWPYGGDGDRWPVVPIRRGGLWPSSF